MSVVRIHLRVAVSIRGRQQPVPLRGPAVLHHTLVPQAHLEEHSDSHHNVLFNAILFVSSLGPRIVVAWVSGNSFSQGHQLNECFVWPEGQLPANLVTLWLDRGSAFVIADFTAAWGRRVWSEETRSSGRSAPHGAISDLADTVARLNQHHLLNPQRPGRNVSLLSAVERRHPVLSGLCPR